MHELAITQSILDIAMRHGQRAKASQITHLYLVIGELSSIVDDSVQFYWEFVSEGTIAEGATLHFHRIPGEMTCQDCQHIYHPNEALICPQCNSQNIQITAGEEFRLDAIDVEHDMPGVT